MVDTTKEFQFYSKNVAECYENDRPEILNEKQRNAIKSNVPVHLKCKNTGML